MIVSWAVISIVAGVIIASAVVIECESRKLFPTARKMDEAFDVYPEGKRK